jgi:hypothetical protein
MAHVQSFEVLLTKCVWSSNFILISIQLAQLKLDLLAPCCRARPLFGSHLCSMTLKRFLKNLMPPLDIWTNNACLTSKYNLFVKYHI